MNNNNNNNNSKMCKQKIKYLDLNYKLIQMT
jgi:hypothetical protein